MILLEIILLVVGFALLIKGADWLVDGASSLARRLNVREIVIGLTVVSFGTSAPELLVNIMSALSGNTDLAIGNIVGSNIANIFLILGVSAAIYPLIVKKGTVWKEIPLSLLAAIALLVMTNDRFLESTTSSLLTRTDGLVMLLFFAIFLYYTYSISKANKKENEHVKAKYSTPVALGIIGLGLVGLIIGGNFIVTNASSLALRIGISQSLIGLTIVAIGTSLPELATSAVAAFRRNADIAVGNIVGSNLFNVFFILAMTSIVAPIPVSPALNFDMIVMLGASTLLFLTMFIGHRRRTLERWEGIGFLLTYAGYISYIAWRG